jgi:hypothetical protein
MWFQFLKYFWPSNLFAGFGFVVSEWYRGSVKDRAILLLIFTPMLICMLGLLFSFAGFVFAFISRLLGWFLLTALFGAGGIFCYEKLRETRPSSSTPPRHSKSAAYDADTTAEEPAKSADAKESKRKKWFEGMRG